jgi:hypothetical protein
MLGPLAFCPWTAYRPADASPGRGRRSPAARHGGQPRSCTAALKLGQWSERAGGGEVEHAEAQGAEDEEGATWPSGTLRTRSERGAAVRAGCGLAVPGHAGDELGARTARAPYAHYDRAARRSLEAALRGCTGTRCRCRHRDLRQLRERDSPPVPPGTWRATPASRCRAAGTAAGGKRGNGYARKRAK